VFLLISQFQLMRIEQLQEYPPMLDQIVTNLSGPKYLNVEAPIILAVILPGNEHTDFLALEAPGADQPNPRGRNVAAQELDFAVVGQKDFCGLDEWNAAVLPSLHIDRSYSIIVDNLADGLVNLAVLLVIAGAGIGNRNVVIAPLAVVKKSLGQG